MVDFRVHDGLPWHPKTIGLTLEAVGLWTYAGCWCSRYLTDGLIPTGILEGFAGKRAPRIIQELTDAHLLAPSTGGYVFVDWLDYQRSAAQVHAAVQAAKDRSARYRERHRQRAQDEP